ncbi:type VII secretion target [Mycolicibacterium austroafricanum]|uniref:type VII secretion target n=1 Tax=Mycolicibacterium austroafricanum TaxID=39687 RepID=UPI001CA3536C|nr:type VII secretion target [Mycolicibacterium austroafricanum]QZT60571.1 ESX-1 secretion-associated protein [Mycolicibacterium austroafricanum]
MSLTVDPEVLRAFAGQVDTTSVLIQDARTGASVSSSADGIPGSTTQWAVRLVGAHVSDQAEAIAAGVSRMGEAVRGAGNDYEVTDAALAESFQGIF